MVTTNVTGNITTPPSTLDTFLAPLIGALCALATLTIWLEGAYVERCIHAAILLLAAVVVVVRGPPRPRFLLVALTAVALWGPLQLIAGGSVYRYGSGIIRQGRERSVERRREQSAVHPGR